MDEQKHIVFYIASLMKGGSERVFVNLAVYLYERGWRVTFVTTYLAETEYEVPYATWRDISKEEAKEKGIRVKEVMRVDESPAYVIPRVPLESGERGIFRVFSGLLKKDQGVGRGGNLAKRTRLLHQIWERLRPDIILSTNGKNNVMALLSSIGMGIPVVVRIGANPSMEYASHQLYVSMASSFRRASGVVIQMASQRKFFPPAIQEKMTIMRNSLDAAFLRTPFEGERERTIVSIGRLDQNKNHALILKAFARIKDKYPLWKIIIYGEGNMRKPLIALSHQLGIAGQVELAGQVDDIADRIYTAGVFVLSSNEEGMPNALLEAMSMGLPVIATDCPCGGPKELIQDAVNGLLIPPGDVAQMETALVRILGNPNWSKKLGLKAAEIQQIYDPAVVNAEWESYLLRQMVAHTETVAS